MNHDDSDSLLEFDVVICGAGVMGSAAAAACAARGVRVALLERFSFLHTRGSSHGPSRIVRRTYPTPLYTSLMSRAYELWAEVDIAAGHTTQPLLRKCGGGLDIVCANSNVATSLRDACTSADVPIIELSPAQALDKYGLHLRSHELAFFQPDSCIVDASRATSVFQDLARTRGAILIENAEVTSLHTPVANVPCILTVVIEGKPREIRAKHVILTPGAWAGPLISKLFPLLPSFPFEIWQCTTMYFERNKTSSFEPLPILIEYGNRPLWTSTTTSSITSDSTLLPPVYSCPVIESGGQRAKFAVHMGVTTTADTRDNVPNIAITIEPVQEWLRVRLPDFNADLPIDVSTCLYTMTPDEDFVLDTIISPRIILAAGFSGHGFKFAPLIGELLSALATDGDSDAAVATALGPQIDSRNVRAAFALNRSALRTRQDLKGA
jgi:sarcosine oxidase/L-pipecolate oxidase